MHIAIEGMDGVGKTTTARLLAARLGFRLVEQPLHLLLDERGERTTYRRCRDYINEQVENDALRAWFYGLGNLLLRHQFANENVITDRHLVSNYYWCGGPRTDRLFDCLVEFVGRPDHTFLIYASVEEGRRRLRARQEGDPDLAKLSRYHDARAKMESFLRWFAMPYTTIDTTNRPPEEVVEVMIAALPDFVRAPIASPLPERRVAR